MERELKIWPLTRSFSAPEKTFPVYEYIKSKQSRSSRNPRVLVSLEAPSSLSGRNARPVY